MLTFQVLKYLRQAFILLTSPAATSLAVASAAPDLGCRQYIAFISMCNVLELLGASQQFFRPADPALMFYTHAQITRNIWPSYNLFNTHNFFGLDKGGGGGGGGVILVCLLLSEPPKLLPQ